MKFSPLNIPDVVLIEPKIFDDPRGFFFESYRYDVFAKNGITENFVQDNHSKSQTGVLRGLHFQANPKAQAKLLRVIKGRILDVAVDIRKGSSTLGKHIAIELDAKKRQMLFVPKGFAHGFCVLEDDTEVLYKASDYYSPADERGIIWNDPDLGIQWPKLDKPFILSDKDQKYPGFKSFLTQLGGTQ